MKLLAATLLGLVAYGHQSFGGGEGFAPHWEPPFWKNNDDPNGQSFRQDRTRGTNSRATGGLADNGAFFRGAEQDDNYMNKDDDRRVYAPAYDDHHSYQHHPDAHKYSDEHFQDDEGQSTRVIHGQDTSQHVNRRSKKKVFDTLKEPKHHFAVQTIDVPFPMHHHYYNHTKVHYHDGYDLYDDDVGDSEKYYHVNPDTNTNVNGWFADDHYRMETGSFGGAAPQFDNDGEVAGYDDSRGLTRNDDYGRGDDNRGDDGGDDRRADDRGDDNGDDNRGDDRSADGWRADDNRADDGRADDRRAFPVDDDRVADDGVVVNTYWVGGNDNNDGNENDSDSHFASHNDQDDTGDDGFDGPLDDNAADDTDDHSTLVYSAPHTHEHVHEVVERRPLITIPLSQVTSLIGSVSALAENAFSSMWALGSDDDRRRMTESLAPLRRFL